MPYIDLKDRERIVVNGSENLVSPGQLNFLLTVTCLRYLKFKGESYQTYNDIMGALEGCKLELYRRRIAEYEDLKRQVTGDCYYGDY